MPVEILSSPLATNARHCMLTEDMHQALRNLICCLGPEWPQDDKFAETVLVVENKPVPVIWTQLQIDKVCCPRTPIPAGMIGL